MVSVLMIVDAPHWACMNVAKGVQKHSRHEVEIAFWWYKTKFHDFDPEDFDVNYIHSGAVLNSERWEWVQSKADVSKWILGYRGASAMRRLKNKLPHPMWDAISCSSLSLMNDLPELKDKLYLCTSGVDLDMFKPTSLPSEFKILWAGTPHAGAKKYNHVQELGKLFPHSFAGPSRPTDPWWGEVTGYKHHEMPGFYAQGSVYVSCSDREGSPLPPREAGAMGRPVVAVRAGDLPEWMPPAMLVDDWREMIPLIEGLRDSPDELRGWGERFIVLARQFGFDRVAKSYDRMFDEVLGG